MTRWSLVVCLCISLGHAQNDKAPYVLCYEDAECESDLCIATDSEDGTYWCAESTYAPTEEPTLRPTARPTKEATPAPTGAPTDPLTDAPTGAPTHRATDAPPE